MSKELKDQLAISFFTTTKGHWGRKEGYKDTIIRLNSIFPENLYRIAHIKVSPNEIEIGEKMEKWLIDNNFKVIKTVGKWDHNGSSHAVEYYKDILKVITESDILKYEFVINCEDDYEINGENPLETIKECIDVFHKDEKLHACRIERDITADIVKTTKISKSIYRHNFDYSKFGPTFTFQPSIIRTLSWHKAFSVYMSQRDELEGKMRDKILHCELLATDLLKFVSNSALPFASFDPDKINVTHTGDE